MRRPHAHRWTQQHSFSKNQVRLLSASDLQHMEAVTQIDNKFILGLLKKPHSTLQDRQRKFWQHSIIAVDQHAAHERVRFERLLEKLQQAFVSDTIVTHRLRQEIHLQLTPDEQTLLFRPSTVLVLKRWGLSVCPHSHVLPEADCESANHSPNYQAIIKAVPEIFLQQINHQPNLAIQAVHEMLKLVSQHSLFELHNLQNSANAVHVSLREMAEPFMFTKIPDIYVAMLKSKACRGE